ncbi:MAG: hypothetical protein EOP60_11100 [Sphingomonadales bacterium]|nr:MAG: hypothetical protein EOP60_11100 [Sphingomonadales bacterium]
MIATLLSLALLAPNTQDPEIRIEAWPAKGFIMRIADHDADQDLVALLTARAAARCGKLAVRFGKFNYDTTIDPQGIRKFTNHTQRFECFDPATDRYKAAPADWQPSVQDRADLIAFVERFMTATDKGDATTGMAMMESILEITQPEWRDTTKRLREHTSGPGRWSLGILGWANNPEGTSHPGSYALVMVDGKYPKLAAYCGTLLVYREAPGRYWISQRNLKVVPQIWIDNGSVPAAQLQKLCES